MQCRITVVRSTKNFIVNNLVDTYLRANPGMGISCLMCNTFKFIIIDKKRPDDDLKELNAKNKITKDMVS